MSTVHAAQIDSHSHDSFVTRILSPFHFIRHGGGDKRLGGARNKVSIKRIYKSCDIDSKDTPASTPNGSSCPPKVGCSLVPCVKRSPTFTNSTRKLQRATLLICGKLCTIVYAADEPAKNLAPLPVPARPTSAGPSIEDMVDWSYGRGQSNIFGILPAEIFLDILEYLAPVQQAALASTSLLLLRLVGRSCWIELKRSGECSSTFDFLSLLERDFVAKSRPLLLCSACMAFRSSSAFDALSQNISPTMRKCELHYGSVDLASHLRLARSDILNIPVNKPQDSFATLQMHHNTERSYHEFGEHWYIPSNHSRHKSHSRRYRYSCTYAHVTTSILRTPSFVCAETRWELPAATVAAEKNQPRKVWDKVLEHPGWACPHNPISAWWLSNYWSAGKEANQGSPPRMFSPMRCRFCATDIEPGIEVLADGKPCLVITTWRILWGEDNAASREWTTQQPFGPVSTCRTVYGRSSPTRSGYLRPGGKIRDAFQECRLTGKDMDIPGLWSETEDGDNGVGLRSTSYDWCGLNVDCVAAKSSIAGVIYYKRNGRRCSGRFGLS